jgi:mannose-1-phosphate guanylyltransferase
MLQRTVERVLALKPKRILIITNKLQVAETKQQVSQYSEVSVDVIAEPIGRNTAPAIALAAAIIAAHDPAGVMVVLPADHFIRDEAALRETLVFACQAAQEGNLVALGIMPSRPETGYGYIEADMPAGGKGPFPVKRFVEKPPLNEAIRYLEDGNYFWNSGMFIWRADTILSEIASFLPDLAVSMNTISFQNDSWDYKDLANQIDFYSNLESVSIDYGIMERSAKVQIVPVEMGWSDVGSWSALPEVVAADSLGTICINAAEHVSIDSSDCLIYSDHRVVATVGLHGLVIVSTPDALLVCDRERAQDVKKVVEELSRTGSNCL